MKILCVEDELSKNIPKIKMLFEKFLGLKRVKQLEKLEYDESGYGADPKEIKQIVESCGIIDIEYKFTKALERIVSFTDGYAMIIADRNLSEIVYDLEDIKKVDTNYKDKFYDKYFEREGDYFLELLISSNYDVNNNFFFLTANSSAKLQISDSVKEHIDLGRFRANNIIDKSDNSLLDKLRTIVNKNKFINIKSENLSYYELLEKYLDQEAANEFLDLLTKNEIRSSDACVSIRKLLEALLTYLAKNRKPDNPTCWRFSHGKKELKLSTFINVLTREESSRYRTNSVIEQSLKSIQKIGNTAAHDLENIATENTTKALMCNFKDIILWFAKIVD